MTTAIDRPTVKLYEDRNGWKFRGIIVGDTMIQFRRRLPNGGGTRYDAKSRVYGAPDVLAADLNALEPEWVHQTSKDDGDDVTRVKGAIWRAWRDTTKKIVQSRLTTLLREVGTQGVIGLYTGEGGLDGTTFSYKAGCSCGCSPGFILPSIWRVGGTNVDLFLSTVDEDITEISEEN